MIRYLRVRLSQPTHFLVIVVALILIATVQVVNIKAAPKKATNTNDNNFKRPGVPTLIDDPGNGSYEGQGFGPDFEYVYWFAPDNWPNGYGSWYEPHSRNFNHTDSQDKSRSVGTDSYSKYIGVSYKNQGDRGTATSTSAHWKYRVSVSRLNAYWHRPIYDFTASPVCDVKVTISPSLGQQVPDITAHAEPDGADISVGYQVVYFPVSTIDGGGIYINPTSKSYHVDVPYSGPHTATHLYKQTATVSTYGSITVNNQTRLAKAWGLWHGIFIWRQALTKFPINSLHLKKVNHL